MRVSYTNAFLMAVLLMLILVLNLRFMLTSPPAPPSSSVEHKGYYNAGSPQASSNAGTYIGGLQGSILGKQRDIDRVETENEKIKQALSNAYAQQPAQTLSPHSSGTSSSLSVHHDKPPPEFPTIPGKYKIKSNYISEYLRLDPKNDFLGLTTGYDPLTSLIFHLELAVGGGPKDLVIKHTSKPKYLGMRAANEPLNWVVIPECSTPSDKKCHFTLEENAHLFSPHASGYVNLVGGEHIRGHDEDGSSSGGSNKGRSTSFAFERVTESEVVQAHSEKESSKTVMKYMEGPKEREYIERIKNLPPSTEKRVISFGLYGDNPKYTTGAIRNAELRDTYFPGWVCRFYVDDSVPQSVLDSLKELGSEIIHQTGHKGAVGGMFWRFLVADDSNVDRYVVRDSDSRLNARDRFAIEEWIESGKCVHNIRDHVNHVRTMNGGLWGGRKGCIKDLEGKAANVPKDSYMQDIYFLEKIIWPLISPDQMSHDAYSCDKFQNSRPFPTQRDENYQHVGQVFFHDDSPRMTDIDGFIRGKKNPEACRPKEHPEWIYG